MTQQTQSSVFTNLFSDELHIRPKQCALLLGVSIATFWRLVSSGKLKTVKLTERTTTVKASDLRAFISSKVGA